MIPASLVSLWLTEPIVTSYLIWKMIAGLLVNFHQADICSLTIYNLDQVFKMSRAGLQCACKPSEKAWSITKHLTDLSAMQIQNKQKK